MKYIFVIQGEGRGHLTQAMTLERLLLANGHEVVAMLVGKSKSRVLPAFFEKGVKAPVSFFESVNFLSSPDNKRPDMIGSIFYNAAVSAKFLPSVNLIREAIRDSHTDVVVNFYEMLCSTACRLSKAPMICVGHQFLFLKKGFNIPEVGYEGHLGLNLFSKAIAAGARKVLALSFRNMPDDPDGKIKVMPPLLRPEVLAYRNADGSPAPGLVDGDYILGYMLNAGFSEEILKWHAERPEVPLRFFWDKVEEAPVKVVDDTLSFHYLDDSLFLEMMASCKAYASTAGFESICEAMYLGKPLLMVPSHIEQKCNAFDATKGPCLPEGVRPAISSDKFMISELLDFAENGFAADTAFPAWARSAEKAFIRELTEL